MTEEQRQAAEALFQLWSRLPPGEREASISKHMDAAFRRGLRMGTPGADLILTPELAEARWRALGRTAGMFVDQALARVYGRRVLHTLLVWPVRDKTHTVGNLETPALLDALKGCVEKYETGREL